MDDLCELFILESLDAVLRDEAIRASGSRLSTMSSTRVLPFEEPSLISRNAAQSRW
jgi:hypothetical protein